MSWESDLRNIQFEIITGDRKIWHPLLIQKYEKNVEYNGTQYDFIDRAGSLFSRKLPKGRSYPIEFAFTGENNATDANSFESSARDSRSWTITHPFYGTLIVQPLNLKFDNTGLTTTVISCDVLETIVSNQPKTTPSNIDALMNQKDYTIEAVITSFVYMPKNINPNSVQKTLNLTQKIISIIKKTASFTSKEYALFQKYSKDAINAINNANALTDAVLTSLNNLIELPSILASDIGSRIKTIQTEFDYLLLNVNNLGTADYFDKILCNLTGSLVLTSQCNALTIANTNDFKTRNEVSVQIATLMANYNTFLKAIYSLEDEKFRPDHDILLNLHNLVYFTNLKLFEVIFEAKQERIFYVKTDTNLIVLTHRLYGLASEENIKYLKETNKIGISELLNIKKGREIIYYL